jgi:catechol 2,3-dioxygenase-like lactoylglutathione lyase family enzyme
LAARINHIAVVSDQYAMAAQFYQAAFGFDAPSRQRNFNSATVGDGYVGLNFNPRRPGRPAGLDHFGIQVDDAAAVLDKLARHDRIQALKRPGNRPFAGITTHDPDGNVFDLSQADMGNRGEIYTEIPGGAPRRDREVSHYFLRTRNPEMLAEFYAGTLGLALANKEADDPNYYLTDGRVTLALIEWKIQDFQGTGIIRPGPSHIGITVESVAALKDDLQRIANENPSLAPKYIDMGPEEKALTGLMARNSPFAGFQMADNNNVVIAVAER